MTAKTFITIGLSSLYFAITSFAGELPKKIELTKDQLYDKIRGGWAGKFIACTYGGPTEFKYNYKIIPNDIELGLKRFPKHYKQTGMFGCLYDDLYLDITFLDIYEKFGFNAPRREFKKALAESEYPLWCANLKARTDYFDGNIDPNKPTSWQTNGNSDDIDFQIEADYAGLMSPANVATALKYAEVAGRAINDSDGYYCGAYVSAMYSLAFVFDKPQEIVEHASKILPPESITYEIVSDIIKNYKENKTDWKKAWKDFHRKYSAQRKGGIYAPYNLAYVVIGLLYGDGDFDKTMDISTRCGLDSDCNPATACGILATITGYSKIPEQWKNYIEPLEKIVYFQGTSYTLEKTYATSYMLALKSLKSDGINTYPYKLSLNVVLPKPITYETNIMPVGSTKEIKIVKGFEKHIESGAIIAIVEIEKRKLPVITKENPIVEFEFEGTGISISNTNDKAHNARMKDKAQIKGNCATLEVYLDGEKQIDANYSFEYHRFRRNRVFENYALPHGKHKVKLVLKNAHEKFPQLELTAIPFKNLK